MCCTCTACACVHAPCRSALRSWGSPPAWAAVRLADRQLQPVQLRRAAQQRDRGAAKLQLTARDAQGLPEKLVAETRHLPGVKVAAPLLEVSANAVGPKGSDAVELVGADSALAELKGALVRKVALTPFAGVEAVVLPRACGTEGGSQRNSATSCTSRRSGTPAKRRSIPCSRKAGRRPDLQPDRDEHFEYVQNASGLHGSRESHPGGAQAGPAGRRAGWLGTDRRRALWRGVGQL